jgi:hypothetical protein
MSTTDPNSAELGFSTRLNVPMVMERLRLDHTRSLRELSSLPSS